MQHDTRPELARGDERPAAAAATPSRALVAARRAGGVTWRSVAIALLLLPVNAYWVVQMEVVRYSAHPTTVSLFFNVVFILLVLTTANRLLAGLRPAWALGRAELLFVYSALAIGSCLCGHDALQVLVPMLTWPYRYAEANGWQTLFVDRLLPRYPVTLGDPDIIRGYYLGNSSLYRWPVIRAWIPVVLTWSGFIAALLFVMLCVNTLLRKQWAENERLSFPIIQLPLQITDTAAFSTGGLFRSRLFWLGFCLAALVDVVNSLNVYYPWIPTVLTPGRGSSFFDASVWATSKPWTGIGWTPLSFYPFVVGLGILMPLDFLFSCWFFYLFWKLQSVASVAMAWDQDPRFPYATSQAFGAYMAFCVFSVWLSRRYLLRVVRQALQRSGDADDAREPVRYRTALVGLVLGIAAVGGFLSWLGMGPWLALVFVGLYLAVSVAITRMRAEMGTPVHDLSLTGPELMLTDTLGPRAFTGPQLMGLSLSFWFNRSYRCHPMPHQLEAFRLAQHTRDEGRRWFWALAAFGFVASVVGFWAMLHLMYDYGARAKSAISFGSEAYDRLAGWLQTPERPNLTATFAVATGFLSAIALQSMRVRFPWWPFHPLAYAISANWEMNLVWLPLLIAWVLKTAILRYGGRVGFQRSIPCFLGLILGQFVVGSLLNILGIVLGLPTYQFWQ